MRPKPLMPTLTMVVPRLMNSPGRSQDHYHNGQPTGSHPPARRLLGVAPPPQPPACCISCLYCVVVYDMCACRAGHVVCVTPGLNCCCSRCCCRTCPGCGRSCWHGRALQGGFQGARRPEDEHHRWCAHKHALYLFTLLAASSRGGVPHGSGCGGRAVISLGGAFFSFPFFAGCFLCVAVLGGMPSHSPPSRAHDAVNNAHTSHVLSRCFDPPCRPHARRAVL